MDADDLTRVSHIHVGNSLIEQAIVEHWFDRLVLAVMQQRNNAEEEVFHGVAVSYAS